MNVYLEFCGMRKTGKLFWNLSLFTPLTKLSTTSTKMWSRKIIDILPYFYLIDHDFHTHKKHVRKFRTCFKYHEMYWYFSEFYQIDQLLTSLTKMWSTKIIDLLLLSLIHIWRCRRSTLCRSRWSPYH